MSDIILNRMPSMSSDVILSEGVFGLDTTTFIPVELSDSIQFSPTKLESKILSSNTKVVSNRSHVVPVMELGKQLLQKSKEGDTDAVRELMSKGAPFSTDWLGTSPLHFAAQGNFVSTCEALLRAGISKDARTKVERTPLHMAAYEGHAEVVELLLKSGADANVKDMLKMTPLHWAVQNEHEECIKVLINYGAQVDVVSKFDKTPLSMAIEQNRMDIAQLLQLAMKMMAERAQNIEIQRATLAATQSLAEEMNNDADIEPSSDTALKDTSKELNHAVIEENANMDSTNINNTFKILNSNNDNYIVTNAIPDATTSTQTIVDIPKFTLSIPKNTTPLEKTTTSSIKLKGRKVITLRSDQFLALTGGKYQHMFKKINNGVSNNSDVSIKPIRRIVMAKNKITVAPRAVQVSSVKLNNAARIESLTKQLNEARRIAEVYKQKYKQKEKEVEECENELRLLKSYNSN